MEPEFYNYEEEEQEPRVDNRKLFVGLFFGCLLGGVIGYLIGTKDASLPGVTELFSSPIRLLTINAVIVVMLMIVVFIKLSRVQQHSRMRADPATRMKASILVFILGLLMAGFIAFYIFERIPH